MCSAVKRKKSWLLRVELVAIVFLACFSVLRPIIADTHIAKTGVLRKILRLSYGETSPEVGTVDEIIHKGTGLSVAIIDGKILYEGQIIREVKIVKVHKDRVEFARNDNSWTQKIGDRPAVYWK
jgi:hypothetical protein